MTVLELIKLLMTFDTKLDVIIEHPTLSPGFQASSIADIQHVHNKLDNKEYLLIVPLNMYEKINHN